MNAIACLQGMQETCHCLQEHVFSCKFTTNLKPLPPNAVTSATCSEHSITSKFSSLLFSFKCLIMWGRIKPSNCLDIFLLWFHFTMSICLSLSNKSSKFMALCSLIQLLKHSAKLLVT